MALLPNLISHWKLDESSGTAVDAHGAYDLTAVNTPGTRAGKIGTARDFIRTSSERFELASNSDFQVTDEDFSFSCWFLRDVSNQFQTICSKSNAGQTIGFACWFDTSNVLHFTILGTTGTINVSSLTTATWYHLACTHDVSAKVIRIYIDGGTPTEVTYTGSGSDDTSTFRIGSFETSSHFDGAIDEFSFWKGRELTSGDVAELYNSGTGIAYEAFTGPPTPPTNALGITAYAPTATGDPTLFEYFPAGSAGAAQPTASTSIAVTSTPPIGANIALLLMAFDNSGTGADGDYSQVTGVTDNKGNTWHKLAEHSNTNGSAGAGATVSAWYCEVDPNTFSSTITTATFSSSIAGRNAAIIYFRSETLSLYAAEILTSATDASTSYGSLSTSLAAKNRMYVRVCAQENETAAGFTPTAGFTTIVSSVQTSSGNAMGLRAELKIATSTSETSNPTSSFSSDTASVFIALEADAAGGDADHTAINTYSMTGVSDAADEVTQITAVSLGVNSSTTADEVTQITPVSLGINVSAEDEVTQIVMYSITSQPIPVPETTVLGITSFAPSLALGSVTISPVTPPLTATTYAPVITAEATMSVDVPVTAFGITTYDPSPPASMTVIVPTTELGIRPRVPRAIIPGTPSGDCCCCCVSLGVVHPVGQSVVHSLVR